MPLWLRALSRFALAALIYALPVSEQAHAQLATQVPPAEVCFNGVTGIGGSIQTLTGLTPGLGGGTTGTYSNVPLTGGSGANATANITVAGGIVSGVVIANPGTNYAANDVLSANSASIGGASGFSIIVASTQIASNLAGGSVGMYAPGTLNFAQTWQNASQSIQNTNPIILDSNGCATIYGVGTYRQILYDNLGNKIWDKNTSVAPTNPYWAALATGTPNALTLSDGQFTATDGQSVSFVAAYTSTGAATLTIGTYTYPIYKNSSTGPVALTGGEITANNIENVVYSSLIGGFVITSPIYAASSISYSFGQVRMAAQSIATVAVTPYGGNLITIGGTNYSVPSVGVTANINTCYVNGVAGQTLSASTLYYVYMWNNSGTLTLNFSTTGHVTDTTSGNIGVEILNGNNHYTLVGMVYPTSGPNLAYSGTNQLVSSWFNRKKNTAQSSFSTTRTTTSATPVELNTEIRTQVLVWSDDTSIDARVAGTFYNTSTNSLTNSYIAVDGTTQPWIVSTQSVNGTGGSWVSPLSIATTVNGLTEGYHYVTLFGAVPGGNTGTWSATTYAQAIVGG
jgi:hypothetical protein